MRILTVRQPWAWAIINGGKDVENRTRNIAGTYCGPVAIHAGKAFDYEAFSDDGPMGDFLADVLTAGEEIIFEPGAIIGLVDLVGVHQGHNTERDQFKAVRSCFQPGKPFGPCSQWAQPDSHHLELASPRVLSEPIPYKGALGLRELPEDVAAQVLAGVAS